MEEIQKSCREVAGNLLKEGKVDLILGYKEGTLPLHTTPCFISHENDINKLVWNYSCDLNLAKYLINNDKKIGVISKGCVGRAIIHLIVEGQLNKENITIIGIPCEGVINRSKIMKEIGNNEIIEAKIKDDQILIKGKDFEKSLPLQDYINQLCKTCRYKIPPISDIVIGNKKVENPPKDNYKDLEEFESKTSEEKFEELEKELGKCIRCYACREACPVCYCSFCFIDQNKPIWFGKSTAISDTMIFHTIRAMHVAGRCVSCGACSSVCPMGIDLNLITRKLQKIVKERFDFESGISLEAHPPLGEHKFNDKQEFILEED
jgi:formate dehydrogenase subunit beta